MKTNRLFHIIFILILTDTFLQARPEVVSNTLKNADPPTITITNLDINDNKLELSYEIKNVSNNDIWISDNFGLFSMGFEVGLEKDNQTLLIRRRLDVPSSGSGSQIFGRYVRVRRGESRKESALLPVPVRYYGLLLRPIREDTEYTKRLVIEIGYYKGDFPSKIVSMLEEAEKNPEIEHVDDIGGPIDAIGWLGDLVIFNTMNEFLPDRNEQISIPYTEQMLKGEQVLRIKVDELLIPYKEIIDLSKPSYPELSSCTRIEIEFKPSMFEYFFPYELHRSLLSSEEMKYLKSQKKAVVNVQESIKLFINEISKGYAGGYIINEHSKTAHIICYNEDKHLLSFKVYDDRYIETEDRHCFWYRGGIKSMKVLTSQIQQIRPFVFRIQCAHNLRTLWHRLRLYHKAKQMRFTHSEGLIEVSEPSPMVYPSPEKWCDSIVEANLVWGTRKSNIELHICPSAGEGRCHYAMNPNCEPNSPPDMVLLFETKAGWNQHGGEELFTFDNHDPKGGCVLLNNGTVKFICTEDELHALRWKY